MENGTVGRWCWCWIIEIGRLTRLPSQMHSPAPAHIMRWSGPRCADSSGTVFKQGFCAETRQGRGPSAGAAEKSKMQTESASDSRKSPFFEKLGQYRPIGQMLSARGGHEPLPLLWPVSILNPSSNHYCHYYSKQQEESATGPTYRGLPCDSAPANHAKLPASRNGKSRSCISMRARSGSKKRACIVC